MSVCVQEHMVCINVYKFNLFIVLQNIGIQNSVYFHFNCFPVTINFNADYPIRTDDLLITNQLLWPAELNRRKGVKPPTK